MAGQIVNSPGMFFRVRDPHTSQIVAWRREVDEAVMRYQLGRHHRILVCSLQGQGLTHITEMPARGEFMPYYGMIGGGFTFVFHLQDDQTDITVEAAASAHPLFHPDPIEPLRLTTPSSLLTQAEVYEGTGTVAPDESLTYMPEFLFGFCGEFLEKFRDWEWYSEDVEKYDFIFVPTSVGVMVNVRNRENGAIVDLTHDVAW